MAKKSKAILDCSVIQENAKKLRANKSEEKPTVTLASIVENVTEQITHKDTATMPKVKANKSAITVQENTNTAQEDTVTVAQEINDTGRKQKHSGILQSLQAFMVNPSEVQTMDGINPRENFDLAPLKAYITTNGVNGLPPVKVMLKSINGVDTLVLTEGHRRLLAAKELQAEGAPLKGIPAMWCDKKETSNDRLLYANLTSNEGKPLDAMEVAKGIAALVKFGWTQKSIAEKLHKTDSWVTQALSMLEATPEVKKAFQEGAIKATTVQSIVHTAKKNGGEDPANKAKVQNTVLAKELTKKEEAKANKGNGKGQGRRGRPHGSASLPKIPTMPSNTTTAKPSTNNAVPNTATEKPSNSGFAEKHMTEKDPVFRSLQPKYENEIARLLNAMTLELFLKMIYKNKEGKDSATFVDVLLQNMPVQALLVTIMNNQKSEGNDKIALLVHKCITAIGVAEKEAKIAGK